MCKYSKTFLLIIFLLFFINYSFCYGSDEIGQYIKSNSATMENSEALLDFNYRLFVFGEAHWWPVNYEIILFHLKLLHEKANVRTVFIESPGFVGVYYNYLLENPQVDLDSFARQTSDYYMLRKDSRDVFQQFRDFYQTLPHDQKFKFVGVDFMYKFQIPDLFQALEMLLPSNHPPKVIENDVAIIREINRDPTRVGNYWKLLDSIVQNFNQHINEYSIYLGNKFEDFENLLSNGIESPKLWNIKYHRYCDYDKNIIDIREEFLYSNISKYIKKKKDEGFIASLGNFHSYLKPKEHWCGFLSKKKTIESATTKLNSKESSLVKNQVCVFRIYYFKNYIAYLRSERLLHKSIRNALSKGYIYTIKLNEKNSPFSDIAEKQYQYVIAVWKDM